MTDKRVFKEKSWSIQLEDCRKLDEIGVNYEPVFVVGESNIGFWHPAIVVPKKEYDNTMPKCSADNEYVVKLFENGEYRVVSYDDLLVLHPTCEPFISYRSSITRFCQSRSMRLALDWLRFRKLPLYFRWQKFSDKTAVYKIAPNTAELPTAKFSSQPFGCNNTNNSTNTSETSHAPPPPPILPRILPAPPKPAFFIPYYQPVAQMPPNFVSTAAMDMEQRLETQQQLQAAAYRQSQSHSPCIGDELRGQKVTMQNKQVAGERFDIDKYDLFKCVFDKGGFAAITDEEWKTIASSLVSNNAVPGLSNLLKIFYQNQLLPVEMKYRKLFKECQPSKPQAGNSSGNDGPISKRRKLDSSSKNQTSNILKETPSQKHSPVRKQRSYSMSSVPSSTQKAFNADVISIPRPVVTENPKSQIEIPAEPEKPKNLDSAITVDSLGAKTHLQVMMKNCVTVNREKSISPPMAPPDCSLNAVANWHRSISRRRMSAPAAPLAIPLDHSKINLDNVNFVLEQLNVLEERLAKRSLHYWNDFGFGTEHGIEQTPCDPFDIRNLQRLREWSQNVIANPYASELGKTQTKQQGGPQPPVPRKERSNSISLNKRTSARKRVEIEYVDENSDSEDELLSDIENLQCEQFNSSLESSEMMMLKEQELDFYLMSFGPTVFLDENGRDITDSNDHIPNMKIEKMVQVQERQISALQQRYSDLLNSLAYVNSQLRFAKRDAKNLIDSCNNSCLKLNSVVGPTLIDSSQVKAKIKSTESLSSLNTNTVPSLVASKLFGSDCSLPGGRNGGNDEIKMNMNYSDVELDLFNSRKVTDQLVNSDKLKKMEDMIHMWSSTSHSKQDLSNEDEEDSLIQVD